MSSCWGKDIEDEERDQYIRYGNRELCLEKNGNVAGLSNIFEPWLQIRITWGNFSLNRDMWRSCQDEMNWNVL